MLKGGLIEGQSFFFILNTIFQSSQIHGTV